MHWTLLTIILAGLLIFGAGMGASQGIDLCAGQQCYGERALLESQANQNDALAENQRMLTEQEKLDRIEWRTHVAIWLSDTDKAWGGFLKTMAIVMQIGGAIIVLGTSWAWVRLANGAVTGANIFFLIRGIVKGVSPVHQKKGGVNSVFMPTANRTLIMHDEQSDIHTEMSSRGTRQHQLTDPMSNAARAMASAHKKRSIVQSEQTTSFWQTVWTAILKWRRSSSSKSVTVQPDDEFH